MTCIAVKKIKQGFEIASDSQTSWGGYKYPSKENNTEINHSGKIYEVNGMTIGCAGNVSHSQMFAIFCKSHKPKTMTTDDLIDFIVEFKLWIKTKFDENQKELSLHGIIISNGKAFTFYDHIEVHEIKDFDSVGSGMFLALGAMEVGASAKKAVKVAIKYDKHCGFEVISKTIKTIKTI